MFEDYWLDADHSPRGYEQHVDSVLAGYEDARERAYYAKYEDEDRPLDEETEVPYLEEE